jgi:hypothetical protein
MPANMYSIIEEKGFSNGVAFIVTKNASVIEAHIYSGIIIVLKSTGLSCDQICGILSNGDVKEITFRKDEVKPEIVQPQVVAQTFPGAVAASAISPARTALPKLLRLVRLLSCLTKTDNDDGKKAFDIMCRQISMLYPSFLPDVLTLKGRMDMISSKFGISTTFLNSKPLPANIYSTPGWFFSNFEYLGNGPIKEAILYFIFFGEMFQKVIRAEVGEGSSSGARPGFAILSKAVYPELQDNTSASIFRGAEKIGDIKIKWSTDKKTAVLFTKADLHKFGLENDSTVNLIFAA